LNRQNTASKLNNLIRDDDIDIDNALKSERPIVTSLQTTEYRLRFVIIYDLLLT